MESVDVIAMPTAPDIAFPHGESLKDPMKIYLSDITTVMPNLAGLPALSVPCGLASGMPVGLQLIGRPLEEHTLLKAAAAFEMRQEMHLPDMGHILDDTYRNCRYCDERYCREQESFVHIYSKENIKRISDAYNERTKTASKRVCINDLPSMIGKKVTLSGWIHRKRSLGGIEFYDLRDRSGTYTACH